MDRDFSMFEGWIFLHGARCDPAAVTLGLDMCEVCTEAVHCVAL